MSSLAVACLQMRSGTRVEENISRMSDLAREAASKGARYIQSPEMTGLLQKNPKKLLESICLQDDDPVFAACSELAKKLGIWFHLGSTPIRLPDTDVTKKAANRAGLFSPDGSLVATYDKIHMFDVAVDAQNSWRESNRFVAGDAAVLARVAGITMGISICYDLRFPDLYRQQALHGATVLTCPSSFTKPTGQAHWEVLLRARAIENGAFMIAAAQGGDHEDGRSTHGHSMIIDPWGKIVAEKADDEPGILLAELDLDAVALARNRVPSLANGQNFSISGNE